jgi:hypothetical protein
VTPGGGDPPGAFPRGFDGHRRAQAGIGLSMTPAERLRWLEETMATMRRWVGRARQAPPAAGTAPGGDAAARGGGEPASGPPPR